jgi:hypothetical protein
MNKLEEYRDKAKTDDQHFVWGFDAAIALDLPVKFAKWLDKLNKRMSKGEVSGDDLSKLWDKMDKFFNLPDGNVWDFTEENLYKYWIENVFKFK